MADKQCKLTITEVVRRLNHLPPEVSREGEIATVEETEDTVRIEIPLSAFSEAGLSIFEPECGIHSGKGA